jgi:acyl transferase domain-containing protein/acyl carrier protein
MSDAASNYSGNEIAIVGMAGRFPGARNLEEFWRNLRAGVESITFFSDDELKAAGVSAAQLNNPDYVKAGTILPDAETFDAPFFGISPREAELLDPQQRVFLECAWEALENAGYDPERYKGWVGVFAGAAKNTYMLRYLRRGRTGSAEADPLRLVLTSEKDYLTTRVSYKLNLRGPSVAVQTACSTSLVSVHLACQSLNDFQCDMALAGGVSVQVPQTAGYLFQEGGYASPDGHCRAFDAKARGTVFGSGVGVVALKRLEDALADGDTIHAVVRGSATNNDGSNKVGFTAPSVEGQAKVIALAQRVAGVSPESLQYVEAHGTGTELGDPIEFTALTQAFRSKTGKKNFCAVGSVKTNFGHLNTASGVAGLIKTVLSLKHRELPPSLNFEEPNPAIDFADSPFYVNAGLAPWDCGAAGRRRAGVSSFGIGGTNAHVIVEEAPEPEPAGPSRESQLLLLSARSPAALDVATARLSEHLARHVETALADAAYTLQEGRRHFPHRRMLVCGDREDAAHALEALDPQRVFTGFYDEEPRTLVFMFPGGGAQHPSMGEGLYRLEPEFREHVDRGVELLKPLLGLDLRELLYPPEERFGEAARRLQRTGLALPALFVTEYALARLWMSWGIRPSALIGHSLGEYTAACLSGVFTFEDALSLVALRGRLFERLPEGAMLSVPLPEAEVLPLLGGRLSLAAVNGERACVASGAAADIASLQERLAARGVESRRLHIDVAAHSAMVEPILDEFTRFVSSLDLREPRIPYVSNVTGEWATPAEARDPLYWRRHLRQAVRFGEGVRTLLSKEKCILLEVGPGQTLSTLVRQGHKPQADRFVVVSSLRHPQERREDQEFILNSLGQLWLAGAEVDWGGFRGVERRRRVELPTYPFERRRYWFDDSGRGGEASCAAATPLESEDVGEWFHIPIWKQTMPPLPPARAAEGEERADYLVFADDCGVGEKLAVRLSRLGHGVFVVKAGAGFKRSGERLFELDPRNPDDYAALLDELEGAGAYPRRILHLWGMTPETTEGACVGREVLDAGFYSLLFLARAIGEQARREPLGLAVVTSGARAVTLDESLCPEKAAALGPCKVIPAEYPHVTCSHVDVALPHGGSPLESKLLDHLIAEFTSRPSAFAVAYRAGGRWEQTFERVTISPADGTGWRLREGGVYLITGGLGGIGLLLAEYLARAAKAKLVLVGRTGLPERGRWPEWLTDDAPQPLAAGEGREETAEKIRKLMELESLGAEVLALSADVSDAARMREVVAEARRRFGPISGVIHAAMVPGGGTIQLRASEVAAKEFAPKVTGTRVLEEVLAEEELDFFVLCSSLSAIQGRFGMTGYIAANSFVDAFAHYYAARRPQTFTVAVDWGVWRNVGSSKAFEARHKAITGEDLSGIEAADGVDAFARVLAGCNVPQVIVSPKDVSAFERPSMALAQSELVEKVETLDFIPTTHQRPNLRTTYVAPRGEAEQALVRIWQKVFGIESIGIHDDFSELGGDSLLAIQVTARVRETFEVELPVRSLFEEPTVARIAARVEAAREEKRLLARQPAEPEADATGETEEGEI